ncbi:MAG TPA: hypothetical protein VFQ54_13325 [Thermomicrobiales bacterium]|nr:hypothetical protein [Thermomicrobiales bacterium]
MSEPFNAPSHGAEYDRFDRFLDSLVTGKPGGDEDEVPDLGIFAGDLHQTSLPPLSTTRKRAIWNDLMSAHPSPSRTRRPGNTGPAIPPTLTIPASGPTRHRPGLRPRIGDSRLGFVPPFAMRPATIVMLTIAMLLAAVAGLAGLGQSKDPGSMTPTALASEHLVVATPMPCLIASPVASPTSAGLLTSTTSTPEIASASSLTATPTGTPACAAATPPPSD